MIYFYKNVFIKIRVGFEIEFVETKLKFFDFEQRDVENRLTNRLNALKPISTNR